MGHLKIPNLYKNQRVLLFKECYALEKIDGTSAHISWKDGELHFFSGGAKHENFVALFNAEELRSLFTEVGQDNVIVYGEAYGGKIQGGSKTYGQNMRFVSFDVKVGETWLRVPNAEQVSLKLGLEFVHYWKISTDLAVVDAHRDADSPQAKRNGIKEPRIMEGVVLRPLEEFTASNGSRIIAKHKRDEFLETRTRREVKPGDLLVLEEANAIAFEWVTEERLRHVLQKLPQDIGIENTKDVIHAMTKDIVLEADNEIVDSKTARYAIGRAAAQMFKEHLKKGLK